MPYFCSEKENNMTALQTLEAQIEPLKSQLISHPLYSTLTTKKSIQLFMETHIFAVWDFMSLVKALQQHLTCTTTPWIPVGSPSTRRLINEIVLGEESDVDQHQQPASHFELYTDALEALGGNTNALHQLVENIRAGASYQAASEQLDIPVAAKTFMDFTFEIIETGQPHLIAAVFTFGREDLIPDMFIEIVQKLAQENTTDFVALLYYLERHIEVDSEEHGPMALQMINELCGDDSQKWEACIEVSQQALYHRIALWDSIYQSL
jgi:hypothetical protein